MSTIAVEPLRLELVERADAGVARWHAWGMAHAARPTGYNVDDLDWLRAELGVVHLELDPWGSVIVTPASDEHEMVVAVLHAQLVRQLALPPGCVRSNGPAWKVPGGSGYTNIPDLAVVVPGWHRVGESHMEPSPLLVVEVGSPSTRGVDRGRKLADYRLGRAGVYVMVDLPALATEHVPMLEVHDFAGGRVTMCTGVAEITLGTTAVSLDLSVLPGTTSR